MRFFALLTAAAILLLSADELPAQVLPRDPPPYIPTPDDLVDAMLDLGTVRGGDLLYDLGSGDGRIVVEGAVRGARAVGIEYDTSLVSRSWLRAESAGVVDRVDFQAADLFEVDFSAADLVTLYLGPEFNLRLRPSLLALRPGARVVSHGFHMGSWAPDSTVVIGEGAGRATLFYWVVPASIDGYWVLDIEGAVPVAMELRQTFQEVAGWITREGRSVEIGEGRVRGTEVHFATTARGPNPELHFSGSLDAGTLVGVVSGPEGWGPRRWTAQRVGSQGTE